MAFLAYILAFSIYFLIDVFASIIFRSIYMAIFKSNDAVLQSSGELVGSWIGLYYSVIVFDWLNEDYNKYILFSACIINVIINKINPLPFPKAQKLGSIIGLIIALLMLP